MARKFRKERPMIYIFCEGESEQAYAEFLRERFSEVAVIKQPSKAFATELFEGVESLFKKNPKYRNSVEETDEIWFFFDVEAKDSEKWDQRMRIIKTLRKLRKKPGIRVRLLMTTGCVEYWFMLHYKLYAPPILTVADKERIFSDVKARESTYSKGDFASIARIAEKYPTAIANAQKVLHNLLSDGLPCLEDVDERNRWLYTQCKTFSTVQEAIIYLESL